MDRAASATRRDDILHARELSDRDFPLSQTVLQRFHRHLEPHETLEPQPKLGQARDARSRAFANAFPVVADKRGLSPSLVEKDYWATHTVPVAHARVGF